MLHSLPFTAEASDLQALHPFPTTKILHIKFGFSFKK